MDVQSARHVPAVELVVDEREESASEIGGRVEWREEGYEFVAARTGPGELVFQGEIGEAVQARRLTESDRHIE